MKILTKKRKFTYIWVSLFTLFVCALFLDGYPVFRSEGENFFHVYLNGVEMGTVGDRGAAEQMLLQARKEIAGQSDDIVFVDADLRLVGEEIFWGEIDAQEDVYAHIKAELAQSVRKTLHRAYTLKVNEYMVNLGSTAEVQELLQDAVDKYATEDIYNVELLQDT